MRPRLASLALFLAGGIAQAQAASENVPTLESCFQNARVADAICASLSNAEQRVDCSVNAQAVELACLEHILSEGAAGPNRPGGPSETAGSAPPADIAPPKTAPAAAHKEDAPVDTVGSVPAAEFAQRPDAEPKPTPPDNLPAVAEAPSGSKWTDPPLKKGDRFVAESNWIVSETTSPVDFGPLVAAVIHSASGVRQDILAVRCRSRETEVSLRIDGVWTQQEGNKLDVDYQIDNRQLVRQRWSVSTDGKTAIYKGDPVEFLQSMPEGATLRFFGTDKQNVRREMIFRLTGLSAVRQKISAACKWAPVTAKTSSELR